MNEIAPPPTSWTATKRAGVLKIGETTFEEQVTEAPLQSVWLREREVLKRTTETGALPTVQREMEVSRAKRRGVYQKNTAFSPPYGEEQLPKPRESVVALGRLLVVSRNRPAVMLRIGSPRATAQREARRNSQPLGDIGKWSGK